jgi:hypothetical protein
MTDSTQFFRLWREADDAGLRITPAYIRGQPGDRLHLPGEPARR